MNNLAKLTLVSISLTSLVLTGCNRKEQPSQSDAQANGDAAEEVVKIGHAGPLTGGSAHLGKDNENGARLAVEEINKAGLEIGGRKVRLELDGEDDGADPKAGTQIAQKFVDEHVVAVIGHLNSGVSIPASRIYNDAGIVEISPSSTNPDYTKQGYKSTYRVVATDAQQGPALGGYALKSLNAKSIAVVDDATAYGKGLADEFAKAVQAGGGHIVAREATTDKATDFRAILTTIKSAHPDVVMFGGMDSTVGPFIRQAAALGLNAKVMSGDGACTEKVAELAGDAVNNLICSEASLAIARMPKGLEFEKRFEARFNGPILFNAPFAYDAVYVVADAMKRAHSTDAAKVLEAMPATDYNGVIGHVAFDAHGDMKEGAITLYHYQDKKKTLLDVVRFGDRSA
ncbi:branched-chain amino acid ABC transporter substrate-binding protein [Paraburkholderia sp. LEh10]|uniref:branched-chain amino acid ABC transporter substrate-binding protein n=1 Tax=Paraburkholderia sp. LEh10 TaxID=2821353 RepID=UPI001AE5A58B|nr:branched-chain amino acid ABC transporter substrate-binding protein [Paraburkholderia sp. LEh10]MBP0589616.1 branched-chain amino acid ABC transporter substrate-binding protein [Paraburkholderia sp. LEh10]